MAIPPVVQAAELLTNHLSPEVVIVDASNEVDARKKYLEKHIAGALFIDVNGQLADIKDNPLQGGRHPLPAIENFSETLAQLGITPDSHVVVYDHKNGSNAAARFWWMLKAVGHNKVQVLDGGLQAAEAVGVPMDNGTEQVKAVAPYPLINWLLPLADITEVEMATADPAYLIIDVRDTERYKGKMEPIDKIAGHIPAAVNIPFSGNLETNGLFLKPEVLMQKYQGVLAGYNPSQIIIHCGSGVTACHTLLAMAYAELEIPKLYVGSWSEWSNSNKKIVTEA